MKLLILTSKSNRHNYFAYKISKYFYNFNVTIIREEKIKIKKKIRTKKMIKIIKNYFLNFIFQKYIHNFNQEKLLYEEKYFKKYSFDYLKKYCDVINLKHNISINSNEAIEIIKGINPNITVVMGTSLINKKIINIIRNKIYNLHTGISPNYRGGLSNFWPIIHKDYSNLGVTIHELDEGIDSGKILFTKRIKSKKKIFSDINCKSIIHGTNLMIKAVNNFIKNNSVSYSQKKRGVIFYNDDFNGYYAKKYFKIISGDQ